MRHKKSRHRLNRFTSWRQATSLSLTKNLLTRQSIKTTKTKAKAVQPFIEKLISLAKEDGLSAKRRVYQMLGDHRLVTLLFNDIARRFGDKIGGYTRILNFGARRGDDAPLVILELTEIKKKELKKPKKEKTAKPSQETTEEKPQAPIPLKEKPPIVKKPSKKFFGGLRNIFKKERDSL